MGDGLIAQAQRIAHTAIGGASQRLQRLGLGLNRLLLGGEYPLQLTHYFRWLQVTQMELQTARQHRGWQLARLGGGEQETDMLRRLLQRLQQRIEAVIGEHMHLVNQIDPKAPPTRRIGHFIQQFPGIFNTGARGGIYFQQVGEAPSINIAAIGAFTTGLRRHTPLTIEATRQDTSQRSLADPRVPVNR